MPKKSSNVIRVGATLETAQKIIYAYREELKDISRSDIAKALNISKMYVSNLLKNNLLCEELTKLEENNNLNLDTVRATFAHVEKLCAEHPSNNIDVRRARIKNSLKDVERSIVVQDRKKIIVNTYPNYSFLTKDESDIWFRAIKAGLNVWLAADAAGIARDLPIKWITLATNDPKKNKEYANWLRVTRKISAVSYLELIEAIHDGSGNWKAYDNALSRYQHFDAKSTENKSMDELKAILAQALYPDIANQDVEQETLPIH